MDGVLRSTQTGSPAPTDSTGVLTFGRAGEYNGEYFAGRMDEVRLSNIARYTTNFTPPATALPSDANTIALWHLNEGSGQTMADASGNGRTGTLGANGSAGSDDPVWSSNTPVSGLAGKQERASGGGHVQAKLAQLPTLQSGETNGVVITTTITYQYDALYRLTSATYSSGAYYDYTYDSVGNRLSERRENGVVITYTHDIANRLIASTGVTYTWDANGNLLSDGASTYAYDSANRLVAVSGQGTAVSFAYNGLGDRISQTVNSLTTNYVLDLNAGLTQVLSDGANAYLYSLNRIGEQQPGGFVYHLPDALGSVRQLADANGAVVLAKGYEPYGSVSSSVGSGASAYGFTGEQQQGGLVYLRARYYASGIGRFLTRDAWKGYDYRPISRNHWLYVYANPVNLVDPSGLTPEEDFCQGTAGAERRMCRSQIRGINTGWRVDILPSPTDNVIAQDCPPQDGVLKKNIKRTVRAMISGVTGTSSYYVTYDLYKATDPDVYTLDTLRFATDEAAAIRTLAGEMGARLTHNRYNGLEGVLILLTAYNRLHTDPNLPNAGFAGCNNGRGTAKGANGKYTLASCFVAGKGRQYGITATAGSDANNNPIVIYNPNARDPLCKYSGLAYCKSYWNPPLGINAIEYAQRSIDTAAVIYHFYLDRLRLGGGDDYTSGRTQFAHRCDDRDPLGYGAKNPGEPNACKSDYGPIAARPYNSTDYFVVHYCDIYTGTGPGCNKGAYEYESP